uniref:Alpha-( )-fucosyltransferase n=1 Tax=Tetraselmis sp. GSL018 TaxID=582737 RepID=A0A061RTN3_9CHLO|eukprot:CAMPEP_0177620594 /NCGR_PEP_ID=MMETSP0419_2-20121207/27018_1 /TAXON_ID=582737 /ORGANISM="Tetraselmis sp., Strain GSL018" /LENGTH=414 /DNA_ID=CAMNT_0019120221 /DNA_START=500 /DNA_END=1744 /DNA_ORIENTATION=-
MKVLVFFLAFCVECDYARSRTESEIVRKALRDYASRPVVKAAVVRPQAFENLVGNVTLGCQAVSPCGVWVESVNSNGKATCRDLCVDNRYLPPRLPGGPASGDAAAAAELQRRLRVAQFPPRCDPAAAHVMGSPRAGLGVAASAGAAFVPSKAYLSTWATPRLCSARESFTCFFRPVTSCARVGKGSAKELPAEIESEALRLGKKGIRDDVATPGLAERGSMWALGQALRFLWQPAAALRRRIGRARASALSALRGPVIGVHVRRGDACASGRRCFGWSDYRTEAVAARRLYGASSIFLASDSDEVVEECRKDNEFHCVAVQMNRSAFTPTQRAQKKSQAYLENRIRAGELDGDEVALSALVDLALLGECDIFIGTFSSAFSRLAVLLMMAQHQHPIPFISLDSPLGQPDGTIL